MVIFLDTGFILALRNKDDRNHITAKDIFIKEILTGKFGKIIVTDYVVDEIMTLILNRIKNKSFATKTKNFLLSSTKIILFFIDDEIFHESMELYFNYFDQMLSFTDCTFLSLSNRFKNQNFHIATFDTNLGKLLANVV